MVNLAMENSIKGNSCEQLKRGTTMARNRDRTRKKKKKKRKIQKSEKSMSDRNRGMYQ